MGLFPLSRQQEPDAGRPGGSPRRPGGRPRHLRQEEEAPRPAFHRQEEPNREAQVLSFFTDLFLSFSNSWFQPSESLND